MTQNIRELLELAALACGYTLVWGEKFNVGGDLIDCTDMPYIKSTSSDESNVPWHPGGDDGDGSRMEAELSITPDWRPLGVICYTMEWVDPFAIRILERYADHNGNRQAARKMASLRVAAEIGRRMK